MSCARNGKINLQAVLAETIAYKKEKREKEVKQKEKQSCSYVLARTFGNQTKQKWKGKGKSGKIQRRREKEILGEKSKNREQHQSIIKHPTDEDHSKKQKPSGNKVQPTN